MRETVQIDTDAFDYIYYDYGLRTYGNMPLIEPLETKEVKEDRGICRGDRHLHVLFGRNW